MNIDITPVILVIIAGVVWTVPLGMILFYRYQCKKITPPAPNPTPPTTTTPTPTPTPIPPATTTTQTPSTQTTIPVPPAPSDALDQVAETELRDAREAIKQLSRELAVLRVKEKQLDLEDQVAAKKAEHKTRKPTT